ncbi:phospholipid/cholesterol/gamma-HCH transport system substrate-binding protein [Tamaricihabitans halophyticus]|uniref:Phospholipid/cholesterol/gamma-HCH transport system substrate-binding protein n=1 Tax=Tamaricihabitans halophyticus TaxID=1262583 RepID=A0A4R2QB93_9PSEU|nr:MCE family protein [Tamaricihabitans halophyticus]TCP45388.1 phospholipid/cholesterol/gamma-HCH transport system substrate-binding protein [Tamaricihabitans halophyticus]
MRQLVAPLTKLSIFIVVTVLLTGVLGFTIANTHSGDSSNYVAQFTDVTGLNAGDDIRMSGVRIGRVSTIETARDQYAEVRFEVEANRELPANVTARIKYRDLVGNRYIALATGDRDVAEVLRPGERIPLERTRPALNLTALFNGFKPLFQAIEPAEVNKLSAQLIQLLQGEGSTMQGVLGHIGSLTSTLANRDAVIGEVITNLNEVLGTLHGRRTEVGELINQVEQLSTGLAEQREPIGTAIESLGELTDSTAGLLTEARPPLTSNIEQLGRLTETLVAHEGEVEKFVSGLSDKVSTIARVASHGGWFNYYMCSMSGKVGISDLGIEVELPLLPLPGTNRPERCGP